MWLATLAVTVFGAHGAAAQVISGEVYDASGVAPVPVFSVRLIRMAKGAEQVVDSVRTDTRGRFQFTLSGGGVFRLSVGPREGEFRDAQVDTIADGDVLIRRVLVPLAFFDASKAVLGGSATVDVQFISGMRGPTYPSSEREAGRTGAAMALFTVQTTGTLTNVVVRGSNPALALAVSRWLSRFRMQPALDGGIPVSQRVCLEFRFMLSNDPTRLPKGGATFALEADDAERALCRRFERNRITIVAGI